MAKVTDMKVMYDIIFLNAQNLSVKEIEEKISVDYKTIYRYVNMEKFKNTSPKNLKYKEFIEGGKTFDEFKTEYGVEFPQPQYWGCKMLKRLVKDSSILPTRELVKKYELGISYNTLSKLFDNGEIKKALNQCLNIKNSVEAIKAKTEVAEKSTNSSIEELVEKIKKLGVKEVILKF